MKKVWKIVLVGVLLISVAGCGSKDVSKSDFNNESQTSLETQMESTTKAEPISKEKKKNEAWINLGFDGEVNVNALPELAENWWEISGRVYIPVEYPGKENGDAPYCYLNWHTYTDIIEVEPPKDIYGLPDFMYEKNRGWNNLFSMTQTLNTNDYGKNQLDIDDQKIVTINGAEFLRVEGTVHNIYEENPEKEKSQKYIAYYGLLVPQEETTIFKDNVEIPAVNSQAYFIMGDTSENQDKFDDVCRLADSIMSTYRIKEK